MTLSQFFKTQRYRDFKTLATIMSANRQLVVRYNAAIREFACADFMCSDKSYYLLTANEQLVSDKIPHANSDFAWSAYRVIDLADSKRSYTVDSGLRLDGEFNI